MINVNAIACKVQFGRVSAAPTLELTKIVLFNGAFLEDGRTFCMRSSIVRHKH